MPAESENSALASNETYESVMVVRFITMMGAKAC